MRLDSLHVRAISVLAVATASGLSACGGDGDSGGIQAPPPATVSAQKACDILKGKTVGGATVTDASIVAAVAESPTYCKVTATIAPQMALQLDLPEGWNGKLLYIGGGGYNGAVRGSVWSGPAVLAAGYAVAQSNGGHKGSSPLDASFASDPHLAYLFGSGSVPTGTAAAKAMLQTAYGTEPGRSYFEGCSNGGREGLVALQRNPELFDGIVVRAPGYNWAAMMGAFSNNAKAVAAPGGAFTQGKVRLLASAVRSTCDAQDGIVDGVVSNPSACSFSPVVLRCVGGTDSGDSCLSDAQLAAVDTWTGPSSFVGGNYTYPGWALTGNEDAPTEAFAVGAWGSWYTGTSGNGSDGLQFLLADATVKGYLANGLAVNTITYDWNSNPTGLQAMEALNSATDPDLRPFMNHGGKVIFWHGQNDAAISYRATTAYLDKVKSTMGDQATFDRFARYYQAPGVDHCSGGPGADAVNLVSVIDAWVTQGAAPGQLTATKRKPDGSVAFTRPLCLHPKYPRYTGPANDVDAAKLASNYTCTSP